MVNTNSRHHRSKPMPLTHECHIRDYAPTAAYPEDGPTPCDSQVAQVNYNIVHSILLMYNTSEQWCDKIAFADSSNTSIATLTLTNPIAFVYHDPVQFNIMQYLLAGIFTGNLDFLTHFIGQQGASAKLPCVFCLARQDQLHKTFRLKGTSSRFPKRTGINSLQKCKEIYKREYMDLDPKLQTKKKKEQVTQYLSHRVVVPVLASVPLGVISLAPT